jgi:hypothetical protein
VTDIKRERSASTAGCCNKAPLAHVLFATAVLQLVYQIGGIFAVWSKTMAIDEKRSNVGRRSGKDRRSGVDTRTEEEKKLVGERRSTVDRRSGRDRRSINRSSAPNGGRNDI